MTYIRRFEAGRRGIACTHDIRRHTREILQVSGRERNEKRRYIRSSSQIINVYKVHDREKRTTSLEFIYIRKIRSKN